MKEKFLKALQDKDFSELFKKGGVSFLMRVGGQIMGFVITFIIAHYFGAKGLGDYVLAVIVLRIFTLLAKLGMDTASIRFIAEYAAKNDWENIRLFRSRVSLLLVTSSIFFSIIMYVFSPFIANIVGANPFYIKLNSLFIMPMAFFILNYQSLRGLKKIAEFSFFYWMSRVTFSAIIILIAVQISKNDNIPIFAFLLGLVIVSILSYLVFSNRLKLANQSKTQLEKYLKSSLGYKEILVVSLPLLLAQSGQFIMAWTDKLMLGGFMNSADVGVYDVAFKLSMFVNIALTSISSITSPKFAEMYSLGDMSRLRKVVHQATKITFWSTLPLVLGFILLSPLMLSAFGEEFKNGFYVLCLLSSARLISALTGPAGNLLQMTGRQFIFMKVLFVGAMINICLNYYLIPIYGIEGAAFSSVFSIVFWNLTMVYYVKREFGFLTIYVPFFSKLNSYKVRLPNFMCIGAAKSGTTSLYDILRQHSEVFIPSFKEPHFFDIPSVYQNGLKWYEKTYFKGVKNEKCIGDFSPTYLFDEHASQRIINDLGTDTKFIIILRNPVDRAYSHYLHSLRDAHENLSFREALSFEKSRVTQNDYLSYLRLSYVGQGMYHQMLLRYFKLFPKENFLIINFEQEFVNQRENTIDKIYNFLELTKEDIAINLSSNKASKAKSIWLKKFMKKTGWWRVVLKNIIPSLKIRQIIKNKIQRANIRTYSPPKLSEREKKEIYNTYFKNEVKELEKLLNKKMYWNI